MRLSSALGTEKPMCWGGEKAAESPPYSLFLSGAPSLSPLSGCRPAHFRLFDLKCWARFVGSSRLYGSPKFCSSSQQHLFFSPSSSPRWACYRRLNIVPTIDLLKPQMRLKIKLKSHSGPNICRLIHYLICSDIKMNKSLFLLALGSLLCVATIVSTLNIETTTPTTGVGFGFS